MLYCSHGFTMLHLSLFHNELHRPYTHIFYLTIVFRLSHTCQFFFRKISWTRNGHKLISSASLSRPAYRRLSAPFSRMLTRRYRMIPQKSGAEMARIRRPGTREALPVSLQDALSISVPQRRLTLFPARDGISLLNRIKTIRELPASRGCSARASERLLYAPLRLQSRRFSLTI